MSRRNKKRRNQGEVELNLAAMLDMAFQLLTFFILTFKPAPVEGDVLLHMPPPAPTTVVKNAQDAGSDAKNVNPVQGLNTLVITLQGDPAGGIEAISVGDTKVDGGLRGLASRLKSVLGDESSSFDQVMIQVDPKVHYQELMRVIDACTRQKTQNKKLLKLNFVELPGT
jgi:biopolymer transport protein ExbD